MLENDTLGRLLAGEFADDGLDRGVAARMGRVGHHRQLAQKGNGISLVAGEGLTDAFLHRRISHASPGLGFDLV